MKTYSLSAFEHIPAVAVQVATTVATGQLPTLDEVRSLATWTRELTEKFGRSREWFEPTPTTPKRDRSAALAELAYLAAENRWSDEQMYVALDDADTRWGKYVGRRDRDRRLVDFINRARTKIGYDPVQFDATALMAALESNEDDRLVWDLDDFLAAEFHIDWVLEGLHPRQGFGLITGFPGVGKTQFGVGMAMHIAGGGSKFLTWPVAVEPAKVLFLSLEMSKYAIHEIIGRIATPYSAAARRNFKIAPVGEAMLLDTEAGQTLFTQVIERHRPAVVLIDSLQKVSSKELSDEVATKELMTFLQKIRKDFDCSILVIHHMRKKSTDQQNKGVELSDVYGSVYLTAEPDWVLNLRVPDPDADPDLLKLASLKVRLGRQEPDMEIRRNEYLGFGFDTDLGTYAADAA